jgi:serine/threonine protein kinase
MAGALPSVGGYQFIRRIGAGAAGQVFEVRHMRSGCSFACKVIDRCQLRDADAFVHFKMGVTIQSEISHPGIIRLCDFLLDQSRVYCIMELCERGI